ncbi:MAG: hypothetical protein M3Z05_23305, partial [Gemmatimonadota bacterium]|nr:hypothetical protein [Gemmatimonadota bacterium]
MSDLDIVIGVDAGGSKTRVIIAGSDGEVLTEVVGSPAAMAPGNADYCAEVIGALTRAAVEAADQSGV